MGGHVFSLLPLLLKSWLSRKVSDTASCRRTWSKRRRCSLPWRVGMGKGAQSGSKARCTLYM